MEELIAALHAQTAAMHDLAESNRAVVDYLAEGGHDGGEDLPSPTYLDGTPKE